MSCVTWSILSSEALSRARESLKSRSIWSSLSRREDALSGLHLVADALDGGDGVFDLRGGFFQAGEDRDEPLLVGFDQSVQPGGRVLEVVRDAQRLGVHLVGPDQFSDGPALLPDILRDGHEAVGERGDLRADLAALERVLQSLAAESILWKMSPSSMEGALGISESGASRVGGGAHADIDVAVANSPPHATVAEALFLTW